MQDNASYDYDLTDQDEPITIGDFVAYLKDIGADDDPVSITTTSGQALLIDGFAFDRTTDTVRLVLRAADAPDRSGCRH